ncbi:SAICAR synthase-like protein [Parathielavia hyrcaniae]|uniref:Kinase n=1 Tax=Parathielavia hyrcaniae TaxID=113614 RepID=A0AAN6T2H0_9PEZI|nr:SAICAR synthase-like protein [Parathielavia hyrcaniae]
MSNPPFAPENAAAADTAAVSPVRVAGDCDPAHSLRVADARAQAQAPTPPARLSVTAAAAQEEEGPVSSVPPPPQTPPPPTTPPAGQQGTPGISAAPNADPAAAKYARGPAVLQRPHGHSLLTQALATARGIPKHSQSDPSPPHIPHPSHPPHHSPEPQASAGRDAQARDSRHAALPPQGDGDSLTRRLSPRKTTMLSATTTSTTVASPVYGGLDLGEVNSMLSGHREFLTRTKARTGSIEANDRERPGRRNTYCTDTAGADSQPSPVLIDSPVALHDGADEQGILTNGRPQARAWKTDQRVSVAPEKAWSIGSKELANREDGQVEKSISDVLAGVEHNNRSRKASHSLRFFKEGLPEEKGKRKENRYPQPAREKSPARAEKLADIQEQSVGGEAVKTLADEDSAAVAERRDRARSVPTRTPEAKPGPGSPEDYFAPKYGGHIEVLNGELVVSPRKEGIPERQESEPVEPSPRAQLRRISDLSVEGRESTEEGEESGEEKISSALFVPHQAPDETQEEPPMSRVPQRSVVPSRRHSRHGDFHPWLVIADEPELDQSRESLDLESEKNGPEAAEYPTVAPELASEQVDETPTVDQNEPAAASSRLSRPVSQYYEDALHDHQLPPKQPLDAIELIPYKHQVGGHTTLWRFSRRAVCKQLNNRENEFYEKIEKYHRDLLAFLPRYIGVLNVTFQKQPRRKSTMKRDGVALLDRSQTGLNGSSVHPNSGGTARGDIAQASESQASESPRVVSQSMQSSSGQIPTVTFVDNQHILPRSLLQPNGNHPALLGRFRSASASAREMAPHRQDGRCGGGREEHSRPNLQERHANSWGYTTVNKKLRNEVFNDAFLNKPIAIHRHRKGHERVARRTLQQTLRASGSDPTLIESHEKRSQSAGPAGQPVARLTGGSHAHTRSDLGQTAMLCGDDDVAPKDVTGTSAPEPQILRDSSPAQKKKRRYSGAGLRRKPKDVRDGRGDLQYFEEADDAGYKGDREDSTPVVEVFQASPERRPTRENRPAEGRDLAPATPVGPLSFGKIPRPVNPKEAQTQRDSRVEYFLLLEDLTAGMKRPCIMDLKMGTRQYGVEANAKKQKSQQGKCAKTTSRELGVRLCGLQVWDVKTQSYVFKDKYYGRDLKKGAEFQAALTRFLYDGVDRASILRHIPTVLQKLDQLEVIIKRLRGYRFYAASLLMFYDGEISTAADRDNYGNGNNNNNNSSYNSSNGNTHTPQHQQQHNYYVDDSTTDFTTDTEDLAAAAASSSGAAGGAPPTATLSRATRARRSRREIDFKMADFANCVTAGDVSSARDRPCPPRHPDEPDNGFLRGLRSLRRYFLRIQRDTREEIGLVCLSSSSGIGLQGRNGNGSGCGNGEVGGFDGNGRVDHELDDDDDGDEVDEGSVSE